MLGRIKFIMPNTDDIYMHDTPSRELFDRDVRAFSHGCVRVQNPREFAQVLLGWDAGGRFRTFGFRFRRGRRWGDWLV